MRVKMPKMPLLFNQSELAMTINVAADHKVNALNVGF